MGCSGAGETWVPRFARNEITDGGAFRGAEAPLFHVIFHVIFHVCFCVMVFRVMVFHVVAGPCHCCCERVDLAAPD